MPFRGPEPPPPGDPNQDFKERNLRAVKEIDEHWERKNQDRERDFERFTAEQDLFDRGEGPRPFPENFDSPFHGLPTGNVPLPNWRVKVPFLDRPLDGVPKEALPIEQIFDPDFRYGTWDNDSIYDPHLPNPNPSGPGQPLPPDMKAPQPPDPWERNHPPQTPQPKVIKPPARNPFGPQKPNRFDPK